MGVSFIRTMVLYLCVVIALRIMGKRQLGELQPSELVVAIMISDLASVPMQSKNIPLLDGIVPIFTLVFLELIFSILVLKSEKLRSLITGRPVQIIKNSKFIIGALSSLRLSVDDVLEQLRIAGYSNIEEVDSAIIETNGQLSVIPKEENRPLMCGDMNLSPKQTYAPYTIISDGKIRKSNLARADLTEEWLDKKLKKLNISNIKDVIYMSVNNEKHIFFQIRSK